MSRTQAKPEVLLDVIGGHMRANRPPELSAQYVDGWLERYRPQLLQVLADALPRIQERQRQAQGGQQVSSEAHALVEADLWTPAKRTQANLAAMEVAAKRRADAGSVSPAERQILARYSGWGGLSLTALGGKLPADFPVPEARGLIHEFYTPTKVVQAVAAMLEPLLDGLRGSDGMVRALEPSCGIGRFLGASQPWKQMRWDAVEYSELSAIMTRLLYGARGQVHTHAMPFERFVATRLGASRGTYGLVFANPPYGSRGASMTEDPDRTYRNKRAYVYFLRRALQFLHKDGLGVFIVPSGFLTSRTQRAKSLREQLLLEHHLAAAYRLPSDLFPGARIVTDLVVFRARGGTLQSVPEADAFIVDGRFFKDFPEHILGTEIGSDSEDDDLTKPARWRYEVEGEFTGLPPLVERPMCSACSLETVAEPAYKAKARVSVGRIDLPEGLVRAAVRRASHHTTGAEARWAHRRQTGLDDQALKAALSQEFGGWGMSLLPTGQEVVHRGHPHPSMKVQGVSLKGKLLLDAARFALDVPPPVASAQTRRGVARSVPTDNPAANAPRDLPSELASAQALGLRVDRYLAELAAEDQRAATAWPELHADLTRWHATHGNPHGHVDLQALAKRGDTGAARMLSAFTRSGKLIAALRLAPTLPEARDPNDIEGLARDLYAAGNAVTPASLVAEHQRLGGKGKTGALLKTLLDQHDWAEDEGALVPPEDYLSGELWPKLDRAKVVADRGDARAARNVARLTEAIGPLPFEEIGELSPRDGWLPIGLVSRWLDHYRQRVHRYGHKAYTLERRNGLVDVAGVAYEDLGDRAPELVRNVVGWLNHDRTLFRPRKRKDEQLDDVRLKVAAEWARDFRAWVNADPEVQTELETLYNRTFRGYVAPAFSDAPLAVARWKDSAIRLHAHQAAAARRLLHHRGGLLAFDVGVGKTYTALATVAAARQAGWARRPVIVVPNSIVWKWYADVKRVLPDFRVEVIGSKATTIQAGPRKGQPSSTTDTPAERAAKWTRLQAGEVDLVLLTYTALGRTQVNAKVVERYANGVLAIRREVALRQRNAAKSGGKLSERQQAIMKEGVSAFVAEQLELPASWEYDPGVAWDELGIDLLVVDEAQNFKNLYLPEPREGGVPRFMGNAGSGAKRAWQLDFRCTTVRERQNGRGVVLLSATPAKNSPLEFYSLLQYVDPTAWTRLGIADPEQFIDRYCRLEMREVVDSTMNVVTRSAVTGFRNLHELRDTLFRYGEFKTAEDVGLKLPKPVVEMVQVDMNRDQDAKYARYIAEIEAALDSPDTGERGKILGYLARMALVAVHPCLDEGYTHKTAKKVPDPRSPKFDALADRIAGNTACGHIVFLDNVAGHQWVKQVLVGRGVPAKRIAVLNAETAKAASARQRIAEQFNGTPAEGNEPAFDVVIANGVAYEGIDLQTRTCAIHHLDLPWEPATLQQRNGRGVRQGNRLGAIHIYYYFSKRSQDGLRYSLITGKRGWMTELIRGQDRETNNPGAQMEMGPEEVLLMISRDPQETKRRLEAVKAKRAAEMRAKRLGEIGQALRGVNSRFRRAELAKDPEVAKRHRLDAEERLRDLLRSDESLWPWAKLAKHVRELPVGVTRDAVPLVPGSTLAIRPAVQSGDILIGRKMSSRVGFQSHFDIGWQSGDAYALLDAYTADPAASKPPRPVHFDRGEREKLLEDVRRLRWARLADWNWHLAPDAWVDAVWAVVGLSVQQTLAQAYSKPAVPTVFEGALRVARGQAALDGEVLPPTDAGWERFLTLSRTSEAPPRDLESVAEAWWHRPIPASRLPQAKKESA
ncbi:MAG: hypothetical protein EP330_08565 [Deltaproteobacteria bacterium]|nr:MAG: hypothetical protein EP330_08565 [Deltaproteobacteria bacterium]